MSESVDGDGAQGPAALGSPEIHGDDEHHPQSVPWDAHSPGPKAHFVDRVGRMRGLCVCSPVADAEAGRRRWADRRSASELSR